MDIWKNLLLFAAAFLGGLSVFFFKNDNTRNLKLILSFSGAYLFAITILHLIPDVYQDGDHMIGVYILGGFLFQIVLEQFSEGIEHGHMHRHQHDHEHHAFPFGVMISLCLHAFLEGMPLVSDHDDHLVFGIALHHIPAAFALGTMLLQSHMKKQQVIVMLFIFAVMAPAGFYLSESLSHGTIGNLQTYFSRIMGVVIGIFLHISTTILFESSVDHRFSQRKLIAVIAGISIALISFLTE